MTQKLSKFIQVDANGEHVTGAGEFGHCGPECPIHGKTHIPSIIK